MAGELGGRQPQAIRAALDVLGAVASAGPGVTAKQISAQLRLSPATVYRLLNILVAEEYLVRLPDLSGFALGTRFAELVGDALRAQPSAASTAVPDPHVQVGPTTDLRPFRNRQLRGAT